MDGVVPVSGLCGTTELGIVVDWQFGFAGIGEPVQPIHGAVCFDVGGTIAPGMVDHHGSDSWSCSAEVIYRNPHLIYNHLLADLLAARDAAMWSSGQLRATKAPWRPRLITHRDPDWDSVVSAHLVIRLVEDGEFPPYAHALVEYACEVDSGAFALDHSIPDSIYAPHFGYLALQYPGASDETKLRKGLRLLADAVKCVGAARKSWRSSEGCFKPPNPGASDWKDLPENQELATQLLSQSRLYELDKGEAELGEIEVPFASGDGSVMVPAFIEPDRTPRCALNKYFVRADGYPFYACVYHPEVQDGRSRPRYILSVDRTFALNDRKVNLRGLGWALENEESKERRANYGSDDRSGPPRATISYASNSDPWFDGCGEFNYTIVDAPRSGSILSWSKVLNVAKRTRYWETRLQAGSIGFLIIGEMPDSGRGFLRALSHPSGFSETMHSYFQSCSQSAAQEVPLAAEYSGQLSCRAWDRDCPGWRVRVLELTAIDVTAERFFAASETLRLSFPASAPAYSLFQLSASEDSEFASRNLLRLAGVPAVANTNAGTVLWGHNVVEARRAPAAAQAHNDFECFLYCVYLREMLADFSRKIAGVTPARHIFAVMGAGEDLRRRFLDFQIHHYQIDITRLASGRDLLDQLFREWHIAEHYQETQSEMDRLWQLELEMRQRRTNLLLGLVAMVSLLEIKDPPNMFVVCLAGVLLVVLAWMSGVKLPTSK